MLRPSIPRAAADYTADEYNYLHHLHAIGLGSTSGDSAVVTTGWQICGALRQGYAGNQIANELAQIAHNITAAQATGAVFYAIQDLCPAAPFAPSAPQRFSLMPPR